MILLIDNFDSFTYNLYHQLLSLEQEVVVRRNNAISIEQIVELNPRAIFISPGPGRPENSGVCLESISLAETHSIPIFGVCLGQQTIAQAFGGEIIKASLIMHGKVSRIEHSEAPLFANVPKEFEATRYHSLVVSPDNKGENIVPLAHSLEDKQIMSIKHLSLPLFGVQFHPESIASPFGLMIISNFLKLHDIPYSDPHQLLETTHDRNSL